VPLSHSTTHAIAVQGCGPSAHKPGHVTCMLRADCSKASAVISVEVRKELSAEACLADDLRASRRVKCCKMLGGITGGPVCACTCRA